MGEVSYSAQCDRVLQYMVAYGSINPIQALQDIGVMRLASRITDLKKNGYVIEKKMTPCINRYGEKCHYATYTLIKQNENRQARVVDMGNGEKRVIIYEDLTERLK